MAEDASEYFASFRRLVSSVVPSFYQPFNRKIELVSYLLLCLAKMPFIPQVTMARSVSELTGKERPGNASPASSVAKTKALGEDKGRSVKERLTLNLKQLGRKNQFKSHPTTAKEVSAAELHTNKRNRMLLSSQTDSIPTSSSGESLHQKHTTHGSGKSQAMKTRTRSQEEGRFTLTLTPEAVLLLQRRNSERHQRSAARNAASGPGAPGSSTDSRRRRYQSATQRNGASNSRAAAKSSKDAELVDIRSIVKISLLNDKYKYDDVEYEEEENYNVDERVVLKCTEWLRGLENKPVTVGNSLNRSASSVKSF